MYPVRMASTFLERSANRVRLLKVLLLLPLVAFLVAAEISSHVEEQIFAGQSSDAPSAERPFALTLKGRVFYVTASPQRTYDQSQSVAFGALALLFAGIIWGRWIERKAAATSG